MGLISKFEGKMEDTVEGAAERMGGSSLSPVQIAKKAEKQMRREKMVGAGKQFAPTLYTILLSRDDDARMFGYYPTLAGETETYLMAKAQEHGLVMDGQPLVRFIADDGLKRGKFEVIAEMVAAPLIRQLRQEEMERYGLAAPRPDGYGAPQPQRRQPQPQPIMQPQPQSAYPPPTQPVQDSLSAMSYGDAPAAGLDPTLVATAAAPMGGAPLDTSYAAAPVAEAGPASAVPSLGTAVPPSAQAGFEASVAQTDYANVPAASYADDAFADPYASTSAVASTNAAPVQPIQEAQPAPAVQPAQQAQAAQPARTVQAAQPQQLKAAAPAITPEQAAAAPVQQFRQAGSVAQAELFDRTNDQTFPLSGAPMRIGRESARDIVVPDINASRTHAEIHQEPSGTWIIADLGSTNGTFLNGRQIKSAPLRAGDTIVIGTTELVFRNA